MEFDFGQFLSLEDKKNLLTQRLTQFAAEGYQISLNKAIAELDGTPEVLDQIEKDLAKLSKGIEVYKAELDALPAE